MASETVVRLLVCTFRVISTRLGDSRFGGKAVVSPAESRRLLFFRLVLATKRARS